ncbi:MAG: hypothetical protein D4R94_03085 [Chitinophagaceae bacterium]|nr:MAG: hypothetical protein D4R94_03085 [Chitinophagaceae bacterium]
MLKNKILFILGFLLLSAFVKAQAQYSVSGLIVDQETAMPLVGASIKITTANKGVVTNDKGEFKITNIANGKLQLSVTHTGYKTLDTTIEVAGKNIVNLKIALVHEEEDLEEVVIVSSSRTNSRIEDLPTKVEVLGSEEVHEENGIKPGNIASLLGDIAGIQIQQTSAATGNADMRIQGENSLTNRYPIVVICLMKPLC